MVSWRIEVAIPKIEEADIAFQAWLKVVDVGDSRVKIRWGKSYNIEV